MISFADAVIRKIIVKPYLFSWIPVELSFDLFDGTDEASLALQEPAVIGSRQEIVCFEFQGPTPEPPQYNSPNCLAWLAPHCSSLVVYDEVFESNSGFLISLCNSISRDGCIDG